MHEWAEWNFIFGQRNQDIDNQSCIQTFNFENTTLVLYYTKLKRSRRFQITLNLILRWKYACTIALYHLCSSERHHFRRCLRWRCSEWNGKHGRKQTDAVEFARYRHFLKERDHCCHWLDLLLSLVSWVVIVKPVGRCGACDILYFTLRDTRTFQFLYHGFLHLWTMVGEILLWTQILKRWTLFHMFSMIMFMVFFPIGVFLYQMLETGLSMTVR